MTTLEEIARQGGGLRQAEQVKKIKLMDPQKLYELWPDHRCSQQNDFSKNEQGGLAVSDQQRNHLVGLRSAFTGVGCSATRSSGHVSAHDDVHEAGLLVSEPVDQARHMHFFGLYRESIGLEQKDLVDRFQHLRAVLEESFARERRARLLPGVVASV